jgi:hypothetical protein
VKETLAELRQSLDELRGLLNRESADLDVGKRMMAHLERRQQRGLPRKSDGRKW